MICPNCECEYIAGVTRCADCDVALVDTLDDAVVDSPSQDSVASLWSGNDPREFAMVKAALEQAQIRYVVAGANSYFIFPSMRAKMEIGVSVADRDNAKKILEALAAEDDSDELTPEEQEQLAIPAAEEDGTDDDDPNDSEDLPENWDDLAIEVWSGNDEDLANMLNACFRENGIPAHKLTEQSRWRLMVPAELDARAKAIIREVVEGAPPE